MFVFKEKLFRLHPHKKFLHLSLTFAKHWTTPTHLTRPQNKYYTTCVNVIITITTMTTTTAMDPFGMKRTFSCRKRKEKKFYPKEELKEVYESFCVCVCVNKNKR